MPDFGAGRLLAMLFQLDRTQYWPDAVLQRQQLRQLDALVAFAHAHIPFWRDRLDLAGLAPGPRLTIDAWRRLPVLTRRRVQSAGDRLRAPAPPPEHGEISTHTTSGSTGVPVTVTKTALAALYWEAAAVRDLLWHDVDLTTMFAALRRDPTGGAGPPGGKIYAGWGGPVSRIFDTGPTGVIDIRSPTADQVAWLVRHRPAYVISFPSNLALVARHCLEAGIRLPGLRGVRTFGEPVTPDFRALIRDAWDVGVVDGYSAEEIGTMALQCPLHQHYHIQSETMLVEVIDDAGQPCGPGEVGRVIVTPLHNFATPLLRYDIGDYAEIGGTCDCGRTLPVLTRILGRARHRVVLPGGERRYAHIGAKEFSRVDAVIQYQVVQTSIERVEIRAVLRRDLRDDETAFLTGLVQRGLGHPFDVAIVPVDAIARTESGKYEDFRSDV